MTDCTIRANITMRSKRALRFILGPVLLSLAVTACEDPKRAADYREANPLIVVKERLSMLINVPGGDGALSADDADGLRRFVGDYLDRGQGRMVVEADGARMRRLHELLRVAGLRSREITVRQGSSGATDARLAVLSFVASAVKVPDCGNWSSSVGLNWSNRRHSSYGCSVQRNLGLMVVNPADLSSPATMSNRDAPHSNTIIYNYTTEPGDPVGGRGIGSPELRSSGSSGEGAAGGSEADMQVSP